MALTVYRRHNAQCTAKHPVDSQSSEKQERSKTWKRCSCSIYAAGSMGKRFRRLRTGTDLWDRAREVAARWEAAGRWPDAAAPATPTTPEPNSSKVTVAGAVKAYLDHHKKNSALNTWLRYQSVLKRITDYSTYRGYTLLEQWGKGDVVQCRDTWTVLQKTANNDMSVIKAFFEFAVDREWMKINPALRVKNFRSRDAGDTDEQKLPFTDAELARIYEACEHYGPTNPQYAAQIKITGKDLSDFISVSVYTGLRIADAAMFRGSRMNAEGEVVVRTTKRGVKVATWLPVWLQQIIRRRSLEVGDMIFGERITKNPNAIANAWRKKLKLLWTQCGPWEAKPTPHRFRHTFARILLERPGVTVKDVAELMGDTEEVIRKYYSAWIPGRQEKLTATLKEAFAATPRPAEDNVIVMPAKLAK